MFFNKDKRIRNSSKYHMLYLVYHTNSWIWYRNWDFLEHQQHISITITPPPPNRGPVSVSHNRCESISCISPTVVRSFPISSWSIHSLSTEKTSKNGKDGWRSWTGWACETIITLINVIHLENNHHDPYLDHYHASLLSSQKIIELRSAWNADECQ